MISREEAMKKVNEEIDYYLTNFEAGYRAHNDYLSSQSEAVLSAIPQVLYCAGFLTNVEKADMVGKIIEKKGKIRRRIVYG